MAKTDVISLVTSIALSADDTTETNIFYDEIVRELGFFDVLTGTQTVNVTANTAVYGIDSDTILSREFNSVNNGFLTKSDGTGLGALFGSDWRNQTGTPLAVSMDQEDDDAFRLVPSPNSDDTVTIIRTETRTDVPIWLELPITFEILSREFLRESDHQDVQFASVCVGISSFLFKMVGVNFHGQQTR